MLFICGNNKWYYKKGVFRMNFVKTKVMPVFIFLTLSIFLLFCILPVHGEKEIYEKVLRFHVIANSDSDIDQNLKLCVRDAVLEYTAPLLAEAKDRSESADIIMKHKDGIEALAKATLEKYGCGDAVSLEVCTERYPMKNYESCCFPAGNYLSVKLTIGEAAGRNWWCVLFPRLCTDLATSKEEQFVAVGFTPDQYKIITESKNATYRIRFKLLEFFEKGS